MELGQRPKKESRSTTAQLILDRARKAFNERGVAAVGIRELARELGLSPGNVSYHFATKETLIVALVDEVHALNDAAAAVPGPLDFIKLDQIIRGIMQRDLEHRWLMRDAVGLMLSVPELRARHEQMQRAREARVDAIVDRLFEAKLLRPDADRELLRVQVLTLIAFWVPFALLAAPDHDPRERLDLHARSALAVFAAYASPAGRRQLTALVSRGAARQAQRR